MNEINNFIEKNFDKKKSIFFLNINLIETLKRIVRIRILNTNFLFSFYQKNFHCIYDKSISKLLLNKYFKKNLFFDLSFIKEILYFNIKILNILNSTTINQKYFNSKFDIISSISSAIFEDDDDDKGKFRFNSPSSEFNE